MKLFKAKTDTTRDKAAKRLRRVSESEVIDWAESAINAFHFQLDAFRRNQDEAGVQELRTSLSTLQGAVDVLDERTTNQG